MKIPSSPPIYEKINKKFNELHEDQLKEFHPTYRGQYLHWDKLRHLQTPDELTAEQWWQITKLARKAIYKSIPFTNKYGKPFLLATVDGMLQKLHAIDRNLGNYIQGNISLLNTQMRDTYIVQSLVEEAITSSQLEGASTTRKVAKEMLRTQRKPKNINEQMIFNNYKAMQFILELKNEKLTINIILELHRILTEKTLDANEIGKLRTTDDINVVDNRDNSILHTPPMARELKSRLQKLCDFANAESHDFFIHPVAKAILLHFIFAYDHPFADGNGRVGRALFYWSMAHQHYWLMEFISISEIIKRAPAKYARAYLYTETDDNDVTYFVLYHLDIILEAINKLSDHIAKQSKEVNKIEELLHTNDELKDQLNYRQITLIKHALKHPNAQYLIEGHRQAHNITYDTARTDLLNLTKLGLLEKRKIGKAFVFISPENLKQRMTR